MRRLVFVLLACTVLGCLPDPGRECLGSNECTDGSVCRAGMCVVVSTDHIDAGEDVEPDQQGPRDSSDPPRDVDSTSPDDATDATDADISPTDTTEVDDSPCPGAAQPQPGDLRINELLANPPSGEAGDANRDGTRDAFEDEFVEVVNVTATVLDLTRTRLLASGKAKVLFADICVPPGEGVIVFGGFRGPGPPIVARGSTAVVSPTRLGLSNSGGAVSLTNASGATVDSVTYTDAPPESLTRAPQLHGQDFMRHSVLPGARLMSPGQCADGAIITTGCPNSAPVDDAGADAGADSG